MYIYTCLYREFVNFITNSGGSNNINGSGLVVAAQDKITRFKIRRGGTMDRSGRTRWMSPNSDFFLKYYNTLTRYPVVRVQWVLQWVQIMIRFKLHSCNYRAVCKSVLWRPPCNETSYTSIYIRAGLDNRSKTIGRLLKFTFISIYLFHCTFNFKWYWCLWVDKNS